MKRRAPAWTRLDDEKLLDLRLCDLKLRLHGTPVQTRIARLYREMAARGIAFRPHVWLAEEWFSPDGVPGLRRALLSGAPPATRLERKMTGKVEGTNANWQMRILRHEAGHAFDSAYRLRRRARWRALFGPRLAPLRLAVPGAPRQSPPRAAPGRVVRAEPTRPRILPRPLRCGYQPKSAWRRRYAAWPARRKLEYVAEFAAEVGGDPPAVAARDRIEALEDNTLTLREHYRRKRRGERRRRRALADSLLRKVFTSKESARPGAQPAATLLRGLKGSVRTALERRAGTDRYGAQQLLRLAIERCEQLELYQRGSRREAIPKLRATLVRMARGYIRSDELRLRLMKSLRALVVVHSSLVPPDSLEGYSDKAIAEWRTEFDVIGTLRKAGHTVQVLGVLDSLTELRGALVESPPDVVFNLLEEFNGIVTYDQHVVAFLELMRQPYTGCNPRGLLLSRDKVLCKQVLAFHRIPTPQFAVFRRAERFHLPRRLRFPLFVKSATEDASLGIAQASVVEDAARLRERVQFMHEQIGSDALVEEFIEGRELYVGVIGNERLSRLPVWEMKFGSLPESLPAIATRKVKWDRAYQKKYGITTSEASDLAPLVLTRIDRLARRIYRALHLSGYARIDFRLRADGSLYVLEANPNPNLEREEDFAAAAKAAGVGYGRLLDRILRLGQAYRAAWRTEYG